jgi:2-polyprenyl-6-methoxyphenol hydroxylase-like FAD-dependent oxidoreductase
VTAPQRRRVVVLGASLAGMFAAAACSGAGHTVTILERDVLPSKPRPRAGVPQGRQPHALLYRGLLALEELLPGLGAELRAAGAVDLDTGDLAWLGEVGWSPFRRRQFGVLSLTRPLLEHLVLQRIRHLPGAAVLDGNRVVSLRPGGHRRWQVVTADGSVHHADLVIDASGRGSRLPAWLAEVGVGPVAVSEVDARTGYATREYAVPPGRLVPAGVVVLQTPETPTGGLALPVEGDRWLVTAVGSGEHRPPRDTDGFESFLRSLRDPAVAEVVAGAQPLTDVAVHRQTAGRRHHYERVHRWPSGLLAVGDAFCAFNPVYGQGVTVAACEAVLLRRALARDLPAGTERRLLRDYARLTALPWGIATGEDLRLPTSDGSPSRAQTLTGWWSREVARLSAHGNDRAQWALTRVYHLMASPLVLLHPALVTAAARARMSGYGPRNPRPQLVVPSADPPRGPRHDGDPR